MDHQVNYTDPEITRMNIKLMSTIQNVGFYFLLLWCGVTSEFGSMFFQRHRQFRIAFFRNQDVIIHHEGCFAGISRINSQIEYLRLFYFLVSGLKNYHVSDSDPFNVYQDHYG
jgi:hypothetical protein